MYFATLLWGAVGAAGVWVVLNSAYVLVGMHIMHRRLLQSEKWRWYARDVGMPLVAVLSVVAAGRLVMAEEWAALPKLLTLCFVAGTATIVAALSADALRERLTPILFPWMRR
jgi:hypothetical protein